MLFLLGVKELGSKGVKTLVFSFIPLPLGRSGGAAFSPISSPWGGREGLPFHSFPSPWGGREGLRGGREGAGLYPRKRHSSVNGGAP